MHFFDTKAIFYVIIKAIWQYVKKDKRGENVRIAICDDEINEANNIRFALMDIETGWKTTYLKKDRSSSTA